MTINAAASRQQYSPAAGKQKFSLDFQFELESDLVVYQTASGATPNETTDILSLNNDYTVVGAGWGNTGERSVNLIVGTTAGDTITIIRDMPLSRDTNFAVSGQFSAADLDDQFDDLVGMVQQVNTKMDQLGLYYIENQILSTLASRPQNTLPKLDDKTATTIPIWSADASGNLIATALTEDETCSTLRTDLANDTNGTAGALLVGYYNASLTPTDTTVNAALDHVVGLGPLVFGTIGQVIWGYFPTLTGWLPMDDLTIGSATSGATSNLGTGASADMEDLFTILWDNCADAQCPVSGGRGASAAADWAANKTINLPRVLERSPAVKGLATLNQDFTAVTTVLTVASTADFTSGMKVQLTTTGTLPTGFSLLTDYWIEVLGAATLSISSSEVLYTEGTYVSASGPGAGIHTIDVVFDTTKVAGEYEGYHDHIQTLTELVGHTHSLSTSGDSVGATGTRPSIGSGPGAYISSSTGTSVASSVVQPTAYMNAFIKYA